MINAVLFDMDGVIVDTEPLHHKAYVGMFNAFNLNVSTQEYRAFTGKSTNDICKHLVSAHNLKCSYSDLVAKKRDLFKSLFETDCNLSLINGVLPLIQSYHKNGIKLVLASSASMTTINQVFNRFNLNQYFIAKLSGNDLKASKPHPEIFEKAAQLANTPKSNCIVIEDSTNGIKAAHAAGIYCVAYKSKHSKEQDYSLARKVISNFNELPVETLKQLKP